MRKFLTVILYLFISALMFVALSNLLEDECIILLSLNGVELLVLVVLSLGLGGIFGAPFLYHFYEEWFRIQNLELLWFSDHSDSIFLFIHFYLLFSIIPIIFSTACSTFKLVESTYIASSAFLNGAISLFESL